MFNPYDRTPSDDRIEAAEEAIDAIKAQRDKIAAKAVADFVGWMKLNGHAFDAKEIPGAVQGVEYCLDEIVEWPDPERDEEDRQWARADYEYERARDERGE